ncbi:MAG TPA: hypothetical protein VFO11_10935 [Candidatus Polarisedimenticolaceae bacterium]|nr:hypothetical protein [Candidatus Polarisedimenticolaceae bacterium]
MARLTSALLCLVALLGTVACAGARYETVTYPPRVNLADHELIGVIEFASPDQKDLAPMVTARFVESARSDQGLVRMVFLQGEGRRPDAARLRQIAAEHGLRTILVGDLRVSRVRPSMSVSDTLTSASVTGSVEATLTVEMIEVDSGASLWSASGKAHETVGGVSVQGAKHVDFGAVDPRTAYNGMVDTLVNQVTRDLRGSWERRRVS